LSEIRSRLGPDGVTGYVGGRGAVTDDTQMALFTAEGLIRASVQQRSRGTTDRYSPNRSDIVHHAYLRWLHTQGYAWSSIAGRYRATGPDGWLVADRRLHKRRAPGNTCLSALRSGSAGSIEQRINDSKGCGGVMRAAPAGLMFADPSEAFQVGSEIAAITHGHPSGWLSAGFLAALISHLLSGSSLEQAVALTRSYLTAHQGHEETLEAVDRAVALAEKGMPAPEELETLGGAWVGEEALAIGLCCALAAPDAPSAILASVNHSGDSDSTGIVCGSLVGVIVGGEGLPGAWTGPLDVADLAIQMGDDLWRERVDPPEVRDETSEWWLRYPGW
jgi:ADP-ribosyl-[dinitrogen reductase] hydrolase